MALAVTIPSHANTTYTASTTTNITYTLSYTYTKSAETDTYTDITLVTAWKSQYTNNTFIDFSTVTHRITSSNLETYQADIETKRAAQQAACEEYVKTLIGNITLPSYTKSRDITSTINGITYIVTTEYSVQTIGGNAENSYDNTSANINCVIKWKIKDSKFAYETYFDDTVMTITADNYLYYNDHKTEVVTTVQNKLDTDLKPKVLDKLIGTITTPPAVTDTFNSADGNKIVYVKTTVVGKNDVQTATECTLLCTTVAGVDDKYGMYHRIDSEFKITPSNFQTWEGLLATFIQSEQTSVKTTDFYNMLSIAIPAKITRTNYTASNGLVYTYTITCSQDTVTVNSNKIDYVTVIKTNSYSMTWSSKSVTFDLYDNYYHYTNAATVLETLLADEERDLKQYLDTLIYTTINKIKVETEYGLASGSYPTKLDSFTYNIVFTNYRSYADNLAAVAQEQFEKIFNTSTYRMFNVAPPNNYGGAIVKNPNNNTLGSGNPYGIIYFYKVEFSHNGTTDSTHSVRYEIKFGKDTGCDSIYHTNTITFGTDDYEDAMATLQEEVDGKLSQLTTYINGLAAPETPKQLTSATIKYATNYGLDTEYEKSLGTASILIKGDNYLSYQAQLAVLTKVQEDKLVTTDLYKMYNVIKPTDIFDVVVKNGQPYSYQGKTYNIGIIYHYEVIFNQGATTGSTNEIQYQINYGSSKAYDTVFTSGSIVFNISNYNNAINTLLQQVQGKLTELGTYITNVAVPEDIYKPTTLATVGVATEFGLDTNYGTSLGNTPITISANNYKQYNALLTEKTEEQESHLEDLELYKFLDMQLPDPIKESYTPTSNRIKFDYKITPSFYQVTQTTFTIRCTTMWDQHGTYTKKYIDKDVTINLEDRTSAYVTVSQLMLQAKEAIREYVATLLPMITTVNDHTYKLSTTSGVDIWTKSSGYVVEKDLSPTYHIKFTTTYDTSAKYKHTYSSDVSFEITSATYSNWQDRYAARVMEEWNKIKNLAVYKMLSIAVPSNQTKTHTANGKTYSYTIQYSQGGADLNSNSFDYKIYWSEGNLDNFYTGKTIVFTPTTYTGASSTFSNTYTSEESAIKTYLNGLNFKQSQTVRLVTDYGLNTSYGTALSSIDQVIGASNYKNHTTTLATIATEQQQTVKNTNAYHILNIPRPSNITNTQTATNGQKYYYRFKYTQGTTSLTSNQIGYVLEYGLTNNYGSTYTSGTFDFNANNYASAANTMEATANQAIADLLKFFNKIIGGVTLPNTITDSWSTKSGKTVNVRTRYEIASSTNDGDVAAEVDSITVKYITEYSLDSSYGSSWTTKNYVITPANYSGYSTALTSAANVEQKALKDSNILKMLNIERPENIDDTMVATNGIVYNYSAKFVQDEATTSKNKFIVVLWYGTSSNPNIVYSQMPKEFTPTTCANATAELTSIAATEIGKLRTFLNEFIPNDSIMIPSAETLTYTSKSGKKFYLKTTFTKGANDNTHCVIRYITVWGPTSTYGNTYSDLTYNITASNFQGYEQALIERAHQEFEKCEAAKFKIWDVELPNDSIETYKTQGKDTYYIKSTFEQSTTTDQINSVKYIITYGSTASTSTSNMWNEHTYTITNTNFSSARTDLVNLANAEIEALEEFLECPNVVLPNDTEVTHTANGFKYNLQVIHSKGVKGNIVISTAKIDGNVFGSATTTTFLSQKDVDSTLEGIVETKLIAMKAKCDLSPANRSERHTIGDCIFVIDTEFVKNPGVVQATGIIKLDGVEYKRFPVNIKANSIESNLETISSTSENNVNALMGVLSNMPSTITTIHTCGGFNYDIKVTYTKAPNSNNVHYTIACDNSVYDTNNYLLDATVLSNTISDLSAVVTGKANELRRKLTNASPGNSSQILTYNGFKYLVSIVYTKNAGSKNAIVKIMIDDVKFDDYTKLVDQSTIDNDMIALVSKGDEIHASLLSLINQSPVNKSYVHQVNGFNFTVGVNYEKAAGSQNVTIQVLLDERVYKSITRAIEAANIATNLNECVLNAGTYEQELKQILNTAPANSNRTVYTVDDIRYYLGSTFAKSATNTGVNVSILLDNNVVETYSENIVAETVAADLERIKNGARTRVQNFRENLNGLKNTETVHAKNDLKFNLGIQYSKDLESGIFTISTKVDGVLYGTPYTAQFNKDNLSDYRIKASNLLQNVISVLNTLPDNISNDYAINGFNFKVGIAYVKEAGSGVVQVYTVLDGTRFEDPATVNFAMDNIALISAKGISELEVLTERLKNVPANYSNIFAVGGLEFRISTNFSKAAGSSNVIINTAVDGENYGNPINKQFDINDIASITVDTASKEENIRDILRGAPQDTSEVFTIRRLNFNIEKLYQKAAGSKVVTTMVKMDGNQYEQAHQEEYNITNLGALTDYNDNLVESLKNKLTNSIPNDIHTTYTRNQFTFVVDIYFTKSVNSDVINVEYYIDSADLANTLH